MHYLCNAFSIQMISYQSIDIGFRRISDVREAKRILIDDCWVSAIGHADTARIVSKMMNLNIEENRVSIKMEPGDVLIVAQVTGGRLPEGATELPEGVTIEFWEVKISDSSSNHESEERDDDDE